MRQGEEGGAGRRLAVMQAGPGPRVPRRLDRHREGIEDGRVVVEAGADWAAWQGAPTATDRCAR